MDTNIIIAALGLGTVVSFLGFLWYQSKKSQEVLPPLQSELKEMRDKVLNQEQKIKHLEKDVEDIKDDFKQDKKKIYDMLDEIRINEAGQNANMKLFLQRMDELRESFNSMQKNINEFILTKK